MLYRIAAPDEYLAITGMGIKYVRLTKASWIWPFQRYRRFSVQPRDYSMSLQAMTKEKLQFLLPVVFTIGPDVKNRKEKTDSQSPDSNKDDSKDALIKYSVLLSGSSDNIDGKGVDEVIKGIIEGETRVLVSSMTMEEIFKEREEFKRRIFRNIQGELDQFGLKIYNANVKELKDAEGSVYFQSLSQKAHEGATNQARIDVADARLKGTVGEAERRGKQEQEIAKINAETAVKKTERDAERARAEAVLATQETAFNRDVELARIEAQRTTQGKDEDLKCQVEVKRAAAELERLRAVDLVKAQIAREAQQQAADAQAYSVTADAQAHFESTTRATDAAAYKTRTDAEVGALAAVKQADARLQQTLKEAEGLSAMASAYAQLGQAFGGPAGLLQYMMIEKSTYVELARANADAIHGLNPKISVWNTGAASGAEGGQAPDSTAAMRNVYQMLPPLMTTINEQTGITLPEWQFGRLASEMSVGADKNVANSDSSKVQ